MKPVCIVLGGPNGSGKSSLCERHGFQGMLNNLGAAIINPDALAKLAPPSANALIWSGREVHRLISESIDRRESFLVESTLSGRNHFKTVTDCKAAGYVLALHFVFLSSIALSKARVRLRVSLGGHDVPEADQDRRYWRCLAHGLEMAALVDEAFFYSNDTETAHSEIARFVRGTPAWIHADAPEWLRSGRFDV
jgi:predicted ABC-type ATPase